MTQIANHPYTLEPYKTPRSRYQCPQCNHISKCFVRYIDTATGQHIAPHVGRCSREDKCGYHYKPREYFAENGCNPPPVRRPQPTWQKYVVNHIRENNPTYIHPELVNASFSDYENNNLISYLIEKYGLTAAELMVNRYRIGTCRHWPGATVFWQLDRHGLVRTGKVMLYDKYTGKRVKQPFAHINWAHRLLDATDKPAMLHACAKFNYHPAPNSFDLHVGEYDLQQCLFGEHLLAEFPDMHVAIVESEKTALAASFHDPYRLWLAAGSVANLSPEICQCLGGRNVTLYPDLGAYDKWRTKARELRAEVCNSTFTVSNLLEEIAEGNEDFYGMDLEDFL